MVFLVLSIFCCNLSLLIHVLSSVSWKKMLCSSLLCIWRLFTFSLIIVSSVLLVEALHTFNGKEHFTSYASWLCIGSTVCLGAVGNSLCSVFSFLWRLFFFFFFISFFFFFKLWSNQPSGKQVSLAAWSTVLVCQSSRLVNLLDHSKLVLPALCFHRSQFIGVDNYHCISFSLESGCDCGIRIYPRAVKQPCHTAWTQPAWITGRAKAWASVCLLMITYFWQSKS